MINAFFLEHHHGASWLLFLSSAPSLLALVYVVHTERPSFQSSTMCVPVWFAATPVMWCVFCQKKFTGTLAYLTGTVSHQAFLKRSFPRLKAALSQQFIPALQPRCTTIAQVQIPASLPMCIVLDPGFNSPGPTAQHWGGSAVINSYFHGNLMAAVCR